VATAVVVARDTALYLVGPPPARPRAFRLTGSYAPPASPGDSRIPPELVQAVRAFSNDISIEADTEPTARWLSRASTRAVRVAPLASLRRARAEVPAPSRATERAFLLELAGSSLELALTTPEEVLITLAREEERVDRAVGREARASEAFLTVPGSLLAEYAGAWSGVRATLGEHHARLLALLGEHARSVLPNLSAVVGPRTAARLLAAAGSVESLSRMRAGRIQLLGTRRRPSPERGPRYGLIYRADGMDEVPADRRGAYARSLGALAAIASRADATTRTFIGKSLVARRDRRIAQLRRSRR
jgi:snoRNA binding domain, fibrillarin